MSGRDSGVESGGSDSGMSVGSPALPEPDNESAQDNSEDLAFNEQLNNDLDTDFGLLSFQKSASGETSPMQLPSNCLTSQPQPLGASSSTATSCEMFQADYHQQHEHTSKIRPGVLVQRKLNCRRRRSNVYPLAKDIIAERKLRHAANTNNVIAVRQLLDEGFDPCAADERQRTPLHFASCKGYTEVAKLLIQHGADLNQRDIVGNTPLHLAACTGDVAMVTLLLKAGTDINAIDNSGRTPVTLAQSKLKLLQNNQAYSSSQLKMEVLQILEMMHIFLQRSGKAAEVDLLNLFSTRLAQHQTREEVDSDVKDLLSNLTHLSLQ